MGVVLVRWRDALKSPQRCEREGIGEFQADDELEGLDVVARDGGNGQQLDQFIRENRRRLVRVEGRLARIIQVLIALTVAIIGGIVVGISMNVMF